MKWYHGAVMFIYNLLMLSVFYHFIGIDAVILYGFAKIMTDMWKGEMRNGEEKRRAYSGTS